MSMLLSLCPIFTLPPHVLLFLLPKVFSLSLQTAHPSLLSDPCLSMTGQWHSPVPDYLSWAASPIPLPCYSFIHGTFITWGFYIYICLLASISTWMHSLVPTEPCLGQRHLSRNEWMIQWIDCHRVWNRPRRSVPLTWEAHTEQLGGPSLIGCI